MTDFGTIGRERELAEIAGLLDAGARWVTLWGPAGAGKSVVAQTTASRAATQGTRAIVVDCGGASNADALCARVGKTLDVVPGALSCASRVAVALASSGPTLLVLDGWDDADPSGIELAESWLDAVPETIVLTTARHRTGAPREVVVEIDPLSMEDALRLFRVRLRALRRGGPDVPDELARALVQRTDGLPLAIELTAALVARIGAERVHDDVLLDLPALRLRGGRLEKSTLRQVLELSWSSLGEASRGLLSQAAVLVHELTAEEAAHVAGVSPSAVVPILVDLCESALLRARPGGRYSMLRTVRACALERLAADPDAERDARRRHSALFTERARTAPVPPGDVEDVIAALRWLAQDPRRSVPLQAVLHLEDELDRTGRLDVLEELSISALDPARDGPRDPAAAACVRRALGRIHRLRGRMSEARQELELAVREATAADTPRAVARACIELARSHADAGELDAARAMFHEASRYALRCGDCACELEILSNLATTESLRGNWEVARKLRDEAIERAREIGDRATLGKALGRMAIEHLTQGDLDRFEQIAVESRQLLEEAGDVRHLAILDLNLGVSLAQRERFDAAAERFEAASRTLRALGDVAMEASAVLNLGALEQESTADPGYGADRFERAAQILRGSGHVWVEASARARLAVALAFQGRVASARIERDAAQKLLAGAPAGHLANATAVLVLAADLALARAQQIELAEVLGRAERAITSDPRDSLIEAAARRLLRLVARASAGTSSDASDARSESLLVSADGAWFRPPHRRWSDLRRRLPLQRILAALVDGALAGPGTPLAVQVLIERGWPGERILPRAAAARVHVAISTLRKLGLDTCLSRETRGYFLVPSVPLVVVDPPSEWARSGPSGDGVPPSKRHVSSP